MGSFTPIHGLRVPVTTDLPDGPNQITALADDVDALLPIDSSVEPSAPENGTIWRNSATGEVSLYDGTTWHYVMGPNVDTLTSGIATAASGVTTITTQQFLKRNGIVYVRVNMVLLAALAAGNIANTTLCTVTDSRFTPLPDFTSYALSSSDNGDMASGIITPAGLIQVCATVRAFSAGDNISFGGSYPAAN